MNMEHETAGVEASDSAAPLALVRGLPVTALPKDLYIPPDALRVFLEAFEGPLDLLLYLIKRQNIDILDIPLAKITEQYMGYIELMDILRLELAGEYLLMAAMLAEIKSRLLLPRPTDAAEEEDPRAELVRRLQEYERYKQAADRLDGLLRVERDLFVAVAEFPARRIGQKPPEVSLDAVLHAFAEVVRRADMFSHHTIAREALSVRERMALILERAGPDRFTDFKELFDVKEGRAGVIVTLLAVLQLLKDALLELAQNEANGPIYVKAAA